MIMLYKNAVVYMEKYNRYNEHCKEVLQNKAVLIFLLYHKKKLKVKI